MKRKKGLKRNYKPETWLYLLLLFISIGIIAISFFIPQEDRWFTIVAGFGCSGIASVVVAWLIEKEACKYKEKANNEMLDHLFDMLDAGIMQELKLMLESYAKRDEHVDIDRTYSVKELSEMISKADESIEIWDWHYRKIGDAFSAVDASSLLNDPIPQHNELYSTIHMAKVNYKAYQDMKKKLEKDSMIFMSHFFVCSVIDNIDDFFSLRNRQIEIVVRNEMKDFIRSYRKTVKKTSQKKEPSYSSNSQLTIIRRRSRREQH